MLLSSVAWYGVPYLEGCGDGDPRGGAVLPLLIGGEGGGAGPTHHRRPELVVPMTVVLLVAQTTQVLQRGEERGGRLEGGVKEGWADSNRGEWAFEWWFCINL